MEQNDGYSTTAEFYDYVVPYSGRDDIEFFVGEAKKSGGPVLEIGCGTGRVLIPTARAGIEIVGLDTSPHMLAVLRRKLSEEPRYVQARVRIVQCDMRSFDFPEKFNLITTPFRPFQHLLTVEDQIGCLIRIRSHLSATGRFILDIFNPYLEMLVRSDDGAEMDEEPEFTMPDGRRVIRRARFVSSDRFSQVNRVELIYYVTYPDGRTERLVHEFAHRYLFRFEAEHLLARCGFEVESVYSDYRRNPYGSAYPGDLLFIARRSA